MDDIRGIVIHFDYGGYYSDEGEDVRWNRKNRNICSLVMKGTLEEVTYSRLVERIGKKIKVDQSTTKLDLSYIPLIVDPKRPSYIYDDEDVFGYLIDVNKEQCRNVLHVELTEFVSENQSFEHLSRNEELVSDYQANEGGISLDAVNEHLGEDDQMAIIPQFSDGENVTRDKAVYMDNVDMHYEADITRDSQADEVVTTRDSQADEVVHVEWDDGIDLAIGQQFGSKDEVKDLVDKAVHENCFEVNTVKSTPTLYLLKCRGQGCKWFLRVAKSENSIFFSVRTYHKMHTCSRLTTSTSRNLKKGTPRLVASMLHEDYPGKFKTPPPKTLIDLVQGKIGVTVSYSTAWRGRKQAASDVRGSSEESFHRLPSYLHMLKKMNPRTVTEIEVDEHNQFKYLFFALGACIEGFQAMRKVIVIDGTHLKTLHGGVLIVAAAQDPDHHHYPIAFGVVDGEKNESWKWFLTILKTLIPDDPKLVFVSDRNVSIINMVNEVYPQAKHGYCIYHLCRNVKSHVSHVRKDVLAKKFIACAQAYTESEFQKLYDDFIKRYPAAIEYLDGSVHESKWARCYFPGERYNIDSTNCVESLNGVFAEARQYSLLPMIDAIVEKISEWFNKYRKISAGVPDTQVLVPRVHGELHKLCPIARKLVVHELNSFLLEYNVMGRDGKRYLVDLRMKTCSCKCFDIDKYPCLHGIAAIIKYSKAAKDEVPEIHDFCSKYYWMEQWVLAYCRTIFPVPHRSDWDVPEEIQIKHVLPPYYEKKKGRKQVTRIPSVGEYRKKSKSKRKNTPLSSWLDGESSGC